MLTQSLATDVDSARQPATVDIAGENPRLARILHLLACPECGSDLEFHSDRALCRRCGHAYPIRDGKIYFIEVPPRTDGFDGLKGLLKRWLGSGYYQIGVNLLAPTYPFNYASRVRRYLDPAREIVVDVGCGNHRIDENVIGLDLFDYDAVDLVCDLRALPFKPGSVDAFTSRSVLEHVPDARQVVGEFERCTRKNGLGLHLIPFLYPYHASPGDYARYTHSGQARLLDGWRILSQTNPTGPVTLFLLCLIEFFSILLSLGSNKVRPYLYLALCGLLFPLKFLDVLLVNRKAFLTLAPTIFVVARKTDG